MKGGERVVENGWREGRGGLGNGDVEVRVGC